MENPPFEDVLPIGKGGFPLPLEMWNGQISSRPNTTDFPQIVVVNLVREMGISKMSGETSVKVKGIMNHLNGHPTWRAS